MLAHELTNYCCNHSILQVTTFAKGLARRAHTGDTCNHYMCRTAVGMYDVQLAYMVVAHSQRDPGEYLMELQQLVKAPTEGLRRHAMDMHLGRFDRALQHLVAAGQDHFPEALQLARAKAKPLCSVTPSQQHCIVLHRNT